MNLARLIFMLGIGAAAATADVTTYDIIFTGTGPIPTAGSFTFDNAHDTFKAFTVTWESTISIC